MCKEMPAIPVNMVVDWKKNNNRKTGPRRTRSTRGNWPKKE
jgi:hypothetical protein